MQVFSEIRGFNLLIVISFGGREGSCVRLCVRPDCTFQDTFGISTVAQNVGPLGVE